MTELFGHYAEALTPCPIARTEIEEGELHTELVSKW